MKRYKCDENPFDSMREYLVFQTIWGSFAEEKLMHMSGIWKNRKHRQQEDFEQLCRLLAEDASKENGQISFKQACSAFKTSEVTLDNMMYAAFGMSGDEVSAMHRRKKPDNMQ